MNQFLETLESLIRKALRDGNLERACQIAGIGLQLADVIAELTPTEKDDQWVARLKAVHEFLCGAS